MLKYDINNTKFVTTGNKRGYQDVNSITMERDCE